MMSRNRRGPAGRRGSNLKARLGIATAVVVGGGAIGAVAVATTSHTAAPAAQSAGYSHHYSPYANQANVLANALNAYSWSHASAFNWFSHLANTRRETEWWHGHSKLAFERGTVVLATKRFVLIRAANGTFNVWWLSGRTRVTNVASSMSGTTALTGSSAAASAAMAGAMTPATSIMTGNMAAAQQVLAPTATTVSVNIAGTGITVSVKVTANTATVQQGRTWWRQPATMTAAGLRRGALVFIAGRRTHHELQAQVILIEKAATTTTTPTTAPTTTPTPKPSVSVSVGANTGTVGGSGTTTSGGFNGGAHS
jgi:hypothetical protein